MILAGDLGATNARLVLAGSDGRPKVRASLPSRDFKTFDALLEQFLRDAGVAAGTVRAAAFGVAGPVIAGVCKTTNLPFTISEKALAKRFRIPHVALMNDLVAIARGAVAASSSRVSVWKDRRPDRRGANVAVIAAGTGLGEAALVWDGARHVALGTEGAHVDFAPRTEREGRLLEFAKATLGLAHVSYETVVAASSIGLLYRFLVEGEGVREKKSRHAAVLTSDDASRMVSELALAGEGSAARAAVELWAAIYGAEARNLALKTFATGGVYVCGGAAERLASIAAEPFMKAFLDTGAMRELVAGMPVAQVSGDDLGLAGSLAHARGLLE
jgi:glucokinase